MSLRSAWHQAAIDGDIAAVTSLIRIGHDLNSLDRYGQAAIMLASVDGRCDLVEAAGGIVRTASAVAESANSPTVGAVKRQHMALSVKAL